MSSIVTAPAAGRRRARGLRKLSSENISKAMDETGAQVTRIGLTFFGTTAFCFLSLFSPDSAKRSNVGGEVAPPHAAAAESPYQDGAT